MSLAYRNPFPMYPDTALMNRPASLSLRSLNQERLLITVSKQMKGFDVHIGAVKHPFEETPKVFQSVRMDMASCVGFKMVDDLMRVVIREAIVRAQRISVNGRAFLHDLTNRFLNFRLPICFQNFQAYTRSFLFRVAFKDALHRRFHETSMSNAR